MNIRDVLRKLFVIISICLLTQELYSYQVDQQLNDYFDTWFKKDQGEAYWDVIKCIITKSSEIDFTLVEDGDKLTLACIGKPSGETFICLLHTCFIRLSQAFYNLNRCENGTAFWQDINNLFAKNEPEFKSFMGGFQSGINSSSIAHSKKFFGYLRLAMKFIFEKYSSDKLGNDASSMYPHFEEYPKLCNLFVTVCQKIFFVSFANLKHTSEFLGKTFYLIHQENCNDVIDSVMGSNPDIFTHLAYQQAFPQTPTPQEEQFSITTPEQLSFNKIQRSKTPLIAGLGIATITGAAVAGGHIKTFPKISKENPLYNMLKKYETHIKYGGSALALSLLGVYFMQKPSSQG